MIELNVAPPNATCARDGATYGVKPAPKSLAVYAATRGQTESFICKAKGYLDLKVTALGLGEGKAPAEEIINYVLFNFQYLEKYNLTMTPLQFTSSDARATHIKRIRNEFEARMQDAVQAYTLKHDCGTKNAHPICAKVKKLHAEIRDQLMQRIDLVTSRTEISSTT
ncbi:MAG: hypothetical protein ACKVH0_10705 [Alphaproteobacteria bacterium]